VSKQSASLSLCEKGKIGRFIVTAEHNNANLRQGGSFCKGIPDGVKGDSACPIDRKAVCACAYGRKRNSPDAFLDRHAQAGAIRVCQHGILIGGPSSPHRTDGVYDIPGFQPTAGGDHRLAGWTGPLCLSDCPAFIKDCRSSGAMDCTIDAAAAHETGIGSVDDRVGVLLGYVSANESNGRARNGNDGDHLVCLNRSNKI
jgi:hypothetical protein